MSSVIGDTPKHVTGAHGRSPGSDSSGGALELDVEVAQDALEEDDGTRRGHDSVAELHTDP
ncbi:MAG: hypothetical protein QM747_18245 [Nocardioides sp.]